MQIVHANEQITPQMREYTSKKLYLITGNVTNVQYNPQYMQQGKLITPLRAALSSGESIGET